MKIEVVPYRPEWDEAFEKEKLALLESLGSSVKQIYHIGSTAVKGLASKPIIDIMMEVESLQELDLHTGKIESLGYEAMGEFGIEGRRYFRKGGDERTHQIHAFKAFSPNLFRHLAFRDYLKNHPNIRQEYETLKLQVASLCDGDIGRYCDGKDQFIQIHETRAIKWMNENVGAAETRSADCFFRDKPSA